MARSGRVTEGSGVILLLPWLLLRSRSRPGRDEESGRSQIYTALVSCDDERPFQPGSRRFLATLRLAGEDVTDYPSIGGHFDLWLGSTVWDGIVTRRLFV